jgi:hypothetical protein
MELAARSVERVGVGLRALALRFLVLHHGDCACRAKFHPVERDLVLAAETGAAVFTKEREMLAARIASVNFAPGMRAALIFDVDRAVFVAIYVAEGG